MEQPRVTPREIMVVNNAKNQRCTIRSGSNSDVRRQIDELREQRMQRPMLIMFYGE